MTVQEFCALPEAEKEKAYENMTEHEKLGVRICSTPASYSPRCNHCKHKHTGKASCDAFPGGLTPENIKHAEEHPDKECTRGIGFEKE